MHTKAIVMTLIAVPGLATAARFSYVNDFGGRTSSRIPEAQVRTLEYRTGPLYNNFYNTVPADPAKYSVQDNWVKHKVSGATFEKNPSLSVMTNADGCAFSAFSSVENSGVVNNTHASYAVQPFGSSLSNGTVRWSFDIRNPVTWPMQYGWCRLALTQRSVVESSPTNVPVSFLLLSGLAMRGSAGQNTGHPVFGSLGNYYTSKQLTPLNWYRFTIEANLTTGACDYRVNNLGANAPSFASKPVGDAIVSGATTLKSGLPTPDDPLAGILLHIDRAPCDTNETNGAISDRTMVYDNIRLEWKAPDAPAFKVIYENDFSTRVKQPASVAGSTADYEAETPSDPRAYSGYTVCAYNEFPGAVLMPYYTKEDQQEGQANSNPAYVDEWKRICTWTYGEPVVVTSPSPNAGGNVLRLAATNSNRPYVNAVQTLNETIKTGKVRVEADIRAPATWGWETYVNRLVVGLGNAKCYSANTRNGFDGSAKQFYAGISSSGQKPSDTYKNTFTPYGSPKASNSSFPLTQGHWYRMILTGDLDGKTFGYALYDLGTSGVAADYQTPEVATYSTNSVPIGDITEVSSLVITCWGLGANWNNAAIVDNIKVWKGVGTENEKLIYFNDFDTRIRYNAAVTEGAPTGILGGAFDTCGAYDGQDLWELAAASGTLPKAEIRGGTNPCAMLSSDGEVKIAQTFPALQTKGGFSFSADLRAPTIWRTDTAEREPYMAFSVETEDATAIRFGLCPTGGTEVAQDFIRRTVGLFVENGGVRTFPEATVTAGHWYRFKGTGDLTKGTWTLEVLDMGATQPASAESGTGVSVCTLSNLAFGSSAGEALARIAFGAAGTVKGELAYKNAEDPHVALFDNILYSQTPSGLVITFR